MKKQIKDFIDAAEMLWVVLANVNGSDWRKQDKEWQRAAAKWRDNYFEKLEVFSNKAKLKLPAGRQR